MRLAATKICLKLDNGISASSAEAPKSADQQLLQSACHEGALKKIGRLAVLVRGLASIYLREIGRELRLLESAGRHIRMRRYDFSPWLESCSWLAFCRCNSELSGLAASLFREAQPKQFLLHPLNLR